MLASGGAVFCRCFLLCGRLRPAYHMNWKKKSARSFHGENALVSICLYLGANYKNYRPGLLQFLWFWLWSKTLESVIFSYRNKETGHCWSGFWEICQPFFKNEVNLHHHKIHYWLHSPKKAENLETFAQKVNRICSIYHGAQESGQDGAHVISTDKMKTYRHWNITAPC